MTIVLETSGKGDSVDYVKIKLFTEITEAAKYCAENTDSIRDEKYWKYCEVIDEGHNYEPARYRNYK